MKLAILGYVGSGKSYVADYISKKKALPCLHLDDIKYDKEWNAIDDALLLPTVEEFMAKDEWIIDGFFASLKMDERLKKADKIVILLLPRLLCFYRVLKRRKKRLQDGYKTDLNPWFIKFALFKCRNKRRRDIYANIAKTYENKTLILKSRREVNEFLNSIQ